MESSHQRGRFIQYLVNSLVALGVVLGTVRGGGLWWSGLGNIGRELVGVGDLRAYVSVAPSNGSIQDDLL